MGAELGTSALWYRTARQEDKLDLALAIEGQDKDGAHGFLGPVFLLLDAALGEYDVATRIGVIEFEDCPSDPAAAAFSPSADGQVASSALPASEDCIFSSMVSLA